MASIADARHFMTQGTRSQSLVGNGPRPGPSHKSDFPPMTFQPRPVAYEVNED